jgi:hypothetical protein
MLHRPHAARSRGASSVEYVIVLLLLAITAVAGNKVFGARVKCKVATALNAFGGASSAACAESSPTTVAANDPPPNLCFVAGTPVVTADGLLPIESLEVGMRVLARAESGGELDWKPVVHTFVSHSRSLVRLTLAGAGRIETLEVTPNHRMHVLDRGWLPAGELAPGRDRLVDESGAPLELLEAEALPDQVPVYNLEVEDFHTYFVGELSVWVHNRAPDPPIAEPEPIAAEPVPVIVVRRRPPRRPRPPVGGEPPIAAPRPPVASPPPPIASPPPPPPIVTAPPPVAEPHSPASGPPSPGSSPPSSPVESEPSSPGTPLLNGFNQTIFDHRMHAPGSIWSNDGAASAAAQQEDADKLARINAQLERARQAARAAAAKLQAAQKRGTPEQIEAADEASFDARMERDRWQRAYDAIRERQTSLDRYQSSYGHAPPPPPDEVVGTLTIHAGPSSADPTRLTPQEVAQMSVGHSWVSFQASPDAAPAHLPFTMWNDAQDSRPTTLGFFPVDRTFGGGRSIPGTVLIPDPITRHTSGSASQSYPLTQAQLDRLLIYADDNRNASYNACTNNCTSWAAGAVSATGHTPPPSRWMGTSWMGIDNPNSLHNGIVGNRPPPPAGGGCG